MTQSDELGRVVIPKEIRRTLRIREGDPLEIYTDREGEVILKKYSPIGEMGDIARQFSESLNRIVGHVALVTDRDMVLAASGVRSREYVDRPLSLPLEQAMSDRKTLTAFRGGSSVIPILGGEDGDYACQVVVPIISEGEIIGSVVLVDRESGSSMGDAELKVAQTAASFIGKQMEN